jgi:hypothetical protein
VVKGRPTLISTAIIHAAAIEAPGPCQAEEPAASALIGGGDGNVTPGRYKMVLRQERACDPLKFHSN